MEVLQDLYLTNPRIRQQWQAFLRQQGIVNFTAGEVGQLEQTVGLFDEQQHLVGTGSIAGQVIKYVAVSTSAQAPGARFNQILSELIRRLNQAGQFHYFVFTKPQYISSFEHIGFQCLAQTQLGAILEGGFGGIQDYLATLPIPQTQQNAAIVMNANPFTRGHRYLVETAAQNSEQVYVFVVQQDESLFTTEERQSLVKAGVHDLPNVQVVDGSEYVISFATFPAYFLPSSTQALQYQTQLDAQLFKNWLVPRLNLTQRYVGEEPLSPTTAAYNDALQQVLPPKTQVVVVPRKTQGQQVISALQVRQYIAQNNLADLAALVPDSTQTFIEQHLPQLQARIQKGKKIDGN
ncbi:[citrate (pro-3S)-lyase] ligase [Bombilactobacillus folatiphilus]|uniref:[Citrate [pro-3S]-lyase] ligase n=1 Tax=Bombilactobacillus folatiphilus TaxID=2923362 RepID=A0ABY4P8S5_9LACO|nr:[citrate (pro-3S)-lyase] ligase [Bombilactobacillus folatiphilus]UQS81931.1 [citrate (pro-3S)-lyase] ligase [Bombilactobacillus folatiphilus]